MTQTKRHHYQKYEYKNKERSTKSHGKTKKLDPRNTEHEELNESYSKNDYCKKSIAKLVKIAIENNKSMQILKTVSIKG